MMRRVFLKGKIIRPSTVAAAEGQDMRCSNSRLESLAIPQNDIRFNINVGIFVGIDIHASYFSFLFHYLTEQFPLSNKLCFSPRKYP